MAPTVNANANPVVTATWMPGNPLGLGGFELLEAKRTGFSNVLLARLHAPAEEVSKLMNRYNNCRYTGLSSKCGETEVFSRLSQTERGMYARQMLYDAPPQIHGLCMMPVRDARPG